MVLYSAGASFASVAVCEAPALIQETDSQFNNSYSALLGEPSGIQFERSSQTKTNKHTYTDMHKCSFIRKHRSEVRHPTTAVHK